MWKRTVFTTFTPLPPGIGREVVMETLKSHTEMIDLNPLVIERQPTEPPPNATPEEYHCVWYSLTDRVQYLPGGLASGQVTYTCCFHDLQDGLQTHCYAPMGLDIKGRWTLGGSLPGETIVPVELGLGAPLQGLWLREDVDMRCNVLMGGFVKRTLKKAHSSLVGRLVVKSQIQEAAAKNRATSERMFNGGSLAGSQASTGFPPSDYDSQGVTEGSRGTSHQSISPGLQSAFKSPLQNTTSYRSDQSDPTASFDGGLHPAALNTRNSGGSQKGSYADPRQGPPASQVGSPPRHYAELPTEQRQHGRQNSRMDGQGQSRNQNQNQGQAQGYQQQGVAELE